MPRPKKPAPQAPSDEVLAYMTAVMRGEQEANSMRLQAGDRLGRYYGLWAGRGLAEELLGEVPVICGEEQLV